MTVSDINRRSFLKGLAAASVAGLAVTGIVAIRKTWGAEEVPVGNLLDATGVLNIYGQQPIDATKLAVEEINARGGLLGRPLKLIQLDTQSDNALYAQYATKLILDDKVVVLVGGLTSASREAVRPVVDKYKQLYIYTEQYEGGVCDKFVFATGATPSQQLATLIPWSIEKYGPKFYTIAADYNYGHLSADWTKVYLEKFGGTLLGEEFIPLDVAEFGSILAHIQDAAPDVIISFLVGGNHMAYYRQHAAAGLKDKIPIVSATFGIGNEHIAMQPSEVEGLVVALPYFQELDNPINKDFVKRWHDRFGADYEYITDAAESIYVGWNFWAMAVEKAGTFDRDPVIEALESGLSFDAPEGKVTINPQSHHAIHPIHLGSVNANHAFDIIAEFPDMPPQETIDVCDLIKNPDQHTQYVPSPKGE